MARARPASLDPVERMKGIVLGLLHWKAECEAANNKQVQYSKFKTQNRKIIRRIDVILEGKYGTE